MQALHAQRPSLLCVANEDVAVQQPWQAFLDSCVDVRLRLQPLPAARGREPNMEVAVLRPNRWGGALAAGAAAAELEQRLFATVTDRSTTFQYCS
jgi:hypothetical protein